VCPDWENLPTIKMFSQFAMTFLFCCNFAICLFHYSQCFLRHVPFYTRTEVLKCEVGTPIGVVKVMTKTWGRKKVLGLLGSPKIFREKCTKQPSWWCGEGGGGQCNFGHFSKSPRSAEFFLKGRGLTSSVYYKHKQYS